MENFCVAKYFKIDYGYVSRNQGGRKIWKSLLISISLYYLHINTRRSLFQTSSRDSNSNVFILFMPLNSIQKKPKEEVNFNWEK